MKYEASILFKENKLFSKMLYFLASSCELISEFSCWFYTASFLTQGEVLRQTSTQVFYLLWGVCLNHALHLVLITDSLSVKDNVQDLVQITSSSFRFPHFSLIDLLHVYKPLNISLWLNISVEYFILYIFIHPLLQIYLSYSKAWDIY